MTNETEAPERITYFHDGDILPSTFTAPHPLAKVPRTEYVPADLSDAKDARIADLSDALSARVAELEAQNRELALQIISSDGQAMDAYYAQKEAEAGLRVALKDAERIDRVWYDNYAALEANMIKVMEHVMNYYNDPHLVRFARATLAELTTNTTERETP